MAMERRSPTISEDKDVLIQAANKLLIRKGFEPLFHTMRLTQGELKEGIKELKRMNDFTSKDAIVLCFNRYTDGGNPKHQYTEHVATHKFPTKSVAKAFIEATIREAWERVPAPSKKWISASRFALNDWIVITADGPHSLEKIMDATIDKKYKLPAPYDYYAEQIMAYHWGNHPQISSRSRSTPLSETELEKLAPPPRIRESNERQTKNARAEKYKAKASKPEKTPKASQEAPASKQPTEGRVPLAAICASLGIDPKEARGALRNASYAKPYSSWEWEKEKVEAVTKDIKSIVEKARKK